jgi:glycosyltransferase involved in cell wall biosynthesis
MSKSLSVSCLVFTLNEEINLPSCLESLAWCDDVVVVDSFSTDGTEAIARAAGARFVQHPFTGFGDQRNWCLDNVPLRHPWALVLDADERVPPDLAAELAAELVDVPEGVAAFRLRRRFHLWGRWLRFSSLSAWVVRLVRVGRVRYVNRGHAETQVVDGLTAALRQALIDENHKGVEDWWARQNRYSTQEALYELTRPPATLAHLLARDPLARREALKALLRRLPGRPLWFFLFCYVIRLGFLDGLDGLRFCAMKAAYQGMIVSKKLEVRRKEARAARRDEPAATGLPGLVAERSSV